MEKLNKGDKVICIKPFKQVDEDGEETIEDFVSKGEKGIVKSESLATGGFYLSFGKKTVWHSEFLTFLARVKILK